MSDDMPLAAGNFAAGSRIGGYLLEEQIGYGGMAVVFRARDERLGRQVALKILAPALAADEGFRQRFIRESRAAAAVDDPHIIPLFEAGEAAGALFIAMRYVPGGDVRSQIFLAGALPAARVAAIVSPVASALDAAHAAGLVHRDVKPANMLLDVRQGRPDHVYLSDFGLSKEAAGSVGLTGTGLFLGTVDYAAPEQVDGRPVDGRADQYALGCTAFEMLCGQPPFLRDQPMAVLLAHLSAPPPPVTARHSGLPGALDPVFARAMAKSPDDRYRTCGEFGDALREALGIARYDAGPRPSHPQTAAAAWAGPAAGVPGPGARATATGSQGSPGSHGPTSPIPASYPPDLVSARRSRWHAARWPIAVASAVIAAAAVAVALILTAQPSHAPAATTSGSPAAKGTHDARAGSARPSLSPSGLSWSAYHDPSGFSINLPAGWTMSSRTGTEVQFIGSPPGFVVLIAWTAHPQADQLADWRQQAAAKAASDSTYQQIRIQRVTYRGYAAADWEFTNISQGELTHVLDRGFIVQPGHLAYAIELYGPDAQWQPVFASMWEQLVTGFRPAS